ncbi:MAG TPA: hypothetical protein DCP31_02245 [Cyanobacteria bacterium UBA8543]|nr:hypothetical protein [Cyanobacteria bacterium UBA8543]
MYINRLIRSLFRFTRTLKGTIAIGLISLLLIISITMTKATAQSPGYGGSIAPRVWRQIQALEQEKRSRTPAQQKINSRLLYAIRARRRESFTRQVPYLRTSVKLNPQGEARIDIKTARGQVTAQLIQKVQTAGAKILFALSEYDAIQVLVTLDKVEYIAAFPEVSWLQPYVRPVTSAITTDKQPNPINDSPQTSEGVSFEQQTTQPGSALSRTTARQKTLISYVGSVTSQADTAQGAALARATYRVDGTGVKIGVISNSYNNLNGAATDIANGDLPPQGVTVIADFPPTDPEFPGTDEGRAMLQLIHDLAPGAQLYFATGFGGEAVFANNIRALGQAGCHIILDDVGLPLEPAFQDGIVAQAINDVTASGALYFSSANNGGNKNKGRSGVWEGNFVNGGSVGYGRGGTVHRFTDQPSQFNGIVNPLTATSTRTVLQWSDPFNQPTNDYDLYVLDSNATQVIDSSTNTQNGQNQAIEYVNSPSSGNLLMIVLYSGQPRFLRLSMRSNAGKNTPAGLGINTNGQTVGHNAAASAITVAAVDVATAQGNLFTGGAANPVENFSADGLRRIFYTPTGSPINWGAPLSPSGLVLQKPDITAADGGVTNVTNSTVFTPSQPFFGTSAAAPHAAAIAALLKSFRHSLSSAQIRSILTSTALDIEAPGVDEDSGYGIVMANRALQKVAQIP